MKSGRIFANCLALVVALNLFMVSASESANPWVQSYTVLRTLYVAPNGTGSGTSSTSPMSLTNAINGSKAGDLIWMKAGTYSGTIHFQHSGTSSNPIIYRAMAGNHVTINGAIEISGAYTWVWGLEVTDPNKISTIDGGLRIIATGVHAINNVVHQEVGKNGITAWAVGPGQVIYGNIVYKNGQDPTYHPHNIYTQNDYSKYGYKYVVGNMLLDSNAVCSNCYNFHAYAENQYVTGYYVQNNIVNNGRFLIGGYGWPAGSEVVKYNYFNLSKLQLGYKRPSQATVSNNYLVKTQLDTEMFWGAGETQYTYPGYNSYTYNEIYNPGTNHVMFETTAYYGTTRCDGCPPIRSGDTWDYNKYSGPMKAGFYANNKNLGTISFSTWKSATSSAGKAFDTHSSEVSLPTTQKVVVIPNEYENGRGHVTVYNWSHASTVTVDLSSIVASGATYKVLAPESAFGTPVKSGTYSGAVSLPTGGADFVIFLVTP